MPIIEEAGGVFTDWDGTRTAFGGSAIATNRVWPRKSRDAARAPAHTRADMLDLSGLDFAKDGGSSPSSRRMRKAGWCSWSRTPIARRCERTLDRVRCTIAPARAACGTRERRAATCSRSSRSPPTAMATRCSRASCPNGPACHTGARSCFGRRVAGRCARCARCDDRGPCRGAEVDNNHAPHPPKPKSRGAEEPSYTRRLLADRNLRLKKIGEEAAELITACADGDRPRAVDEFADLLYHALVALRAAGGSLSDVQRVLAKRATPAMQVRKEEPKIDPKDDPKLKKRR